MLAVEDGVAANEGVFHLPIAVEGAVRDAVDQGDGGAEAVAFEVLEVVIEDLVVFANDSNAAGLFLFVAEEAVLFNDATVAVAEGEGTGDFEKGVGSVGVSAGFVGDALGLPIARVEKVLLNETPRLSHGTVAIPKAQSFTAVLAQLGSGAKVIVVDVMVSEIVVSQPNDDRGASDFLPSMRQWSS